MVPAQFPWMATEKGKHEKGQLGVYMHVGEGDKEEAKLAENRLHLNYIQTSHKAQRTGQ